MKDATSQYRWYTAITYYIYRHAAMRPWVCWSWFLLAVLQICFRLGLGKCTCSERSHAWLHVVRTIQVHRIRVLVRIRIHSISSVLVQERQTQTQAIDQFSCNTRVRITVAGLPKTSSVWLGSSSTSATVITTTLPQIFIISLPKWYKSYLDHRKFRRDGLPVCLEIRFGKACSSSDT